MARRVAQEGGRAGSVLSGQNWQQTHPKECLGWNPSRRNHSEDPKPCASLGSKVGMQLHPARTEPAKCHRACSSATQKVAAGARFPPSGSIPPQGEQSHLRAVLAEGAATGTRSAPAPAGQSGCQGTESPRKLQYDSLNYTNCVSWYWGRINIVFLMLDFINTIGFSLTLRNCIAQFLQTISHQLCSFRFADDW